MKFNVNAILLSLGAIAIAIGTPSETNADLAAGKQENPATVDFHKWENVWGIWPIQGDGKVVARHVDIVHVFKRGVNCDDEDVAGDSKHGELKFAVVKRHGGSEHHEVTTPVAIVETVTSCSTLTLAHSVTLPSEIVNPSAPLVGTDSILTAGSSTVRLTLSIIPQPAPTSTPTGEASVVQTPGTPAVVVPSGPTSIDSASSVVSIPTDATSGLSTLSTSSVSTPDTASTFTSVSESEVPPTSFTPTPTATGTSGATELEVYGALGGLTVLAVALVFTL